MASEDLGGAPERPDGEGGGPEVTPDPTPAPAAELPAAAPAAALAAAASTATPAVPPPWEEVEVAALLEAEKLKANEGGVNGAALPEGWVDLSMIEDRSTPQSRCAELSSGIRTRMSTSTFL